MDIKIVLFDVDGTLIKAGGAGSNAMSIAFHLLFNKVKAFERVKFTGMTDPTIFKEAYIHSFGRFPSNFDFERFFKVYLKILAWEVEHSTKFRVLPGVPSLIRELKKMGIKVGLATGNLEEGARIKLQRAGLWDEFEFGGFGSDSEDRAELTRIAVERSRLRDVEPQQVLVVGDSPAEYYAAAMNGYKVALVSTGWTSWNELNGLLPNYIFEDFSDYEGVIDEIFGRNRSSRNSKE